MFALALLIAVAGAPNGAERATLCIEVTDGTGVTTSGLVAAMRARIAATQIEVTRCTPGERPTWKLTLAAHSPVSVRLSLVGADVDDRRVVTVDGLTPEEIVQFISLTAAEAVRPSMNALLKRMGIDAAPPEDPVAQIEATKCAEPVCPAPVRIVETATVVAAPVFGLGLVVGPVFGVQEGDLAGYGEAQGLLTFGPATVLAYLGFRARPSESSAALTLSLTELEVGVGAYFTWRALNFGARAHSRLTIVGSTGGAPAVPDGTQYFWNGGLGVLAGLDVWETETWELGITAQAWLTPQPNRFRAEGEVVLGQSHLELLVGPSLRFFPTSKRF